MNLISWNGGRAIDIDITVTERPLPRFLSFFAASNARHAANLRMVRAHPRAMTYYSAGNTFFRLPGLLSILALAASAILAIFVTPLPIWFVWFAAMYASFSSLIWVLFERIAIWIAKRTQGATA